MNCILVVAAASISAAWAEKPDGTCGYQCTADSQCGGCGDAGAGICSCPDKDVAFPEISCTCVARPDKAPAQPPPSFDDSVWPTQWTADANIWIYKDFTDKASTAGGKFYYDGKLGLTRLDWISGKKGKQVWIGSGPGHPDSDYYASAGPVCFKFKIGDPGIKGKPMVGVEYPDWMKRCGDAGFAKYIGREAIKVDKESVWVDHYSCRLDYDNSLTNQSITFQNWHSIGVNSLLPKGLPLRVTGGNSVPDPNQSPRLNNVWYSNFVTGPNATKPEDFKPPTNPLGLPCVPLAAEETEAFFGHSVNRQHLLSPAFHDRAAYLPHSKATNKDLQRARQPKPSSAFRGDSFDEAMQKLNKVLLSEKGLRTKDCAEFDVSDLHKMQRLLYDARTPELDKIYQNKGDTRKMAHANAAALEAEQRKVLKLHSESPELASKAKDGACHEMVMWYIHHLSASAREEIKQTLELPLLPMKLHPAPVSSTAPLHQDSHRRYTEQASCAVCHVTAGADTVVV